MGTKKVKKRKKKPRKKKVKPANLLLEIEKFLDKYLGKKAPSLGKTGVSWVVFLLPWLALIFGFLGVVSGLGGLGCSLAVSPLLFLGGPQLPSFAFAYFGLTLFRSTLKILAVPTLITKTKRGWRLIFYSTLLRGITGILYPSYWNLILALAELYFLFQVKKEYK